MFLFDYACLVAFVSLKDKFITAPVLIVLDWNEPFEIMCSSSAYAIEAVLGQRREKVFRAIYYSSRTLNEAQENYTTAEKEILAVIYSSDKFRPYIIGSRVIFYTDHAAILLLI